MTSVSVLLTCYNEADYIEEAIMSVVRQTRYDAVDKIVIVNDGSEDQSEDVILRLANKYSKIEYIYQENQGLAAARNTGLSHCTGDFVAILDGDDIWLEEKIERQLRFVALHPDVGLVYSDFYIFNGSRKYVRTTHIDYTDEHPLLDLYGDRHAGPIVPSTTLINRKILSSVGAFDPILRRAQDTDLWMRIAADHKIHHIDEALIYRRKRNNSLGANTAKKAKYLLYVADKIADQYPQVSHLRGKRKAIIQSGAARFLAVSEKRLEAICTAFSAIAHAPHLFEAYATLLFVLLPVTDSKLQQLLKMLRNLKRNSVRAHLLELLEGVRTRFIG